MGDLNNDPNDGNSRHGAIEELLGHDRVTDPTPTSPGGRKAGKTDGGANQSHEGKHARDTADFSDDRVGNLRVDYALPSSGLTVDESGVWWPAPGEDHADLAGVSDHRPVWVDVTVSSR
jgi:endonuclease/exonuclease/phosphatase family metal-dependent hydrolase